MNPDVIAHDGTLSSVYAVPSIRSEVTNIGRYLPAGSVDDFKENAKNNGKLHQVYLTELNEVLYEIFDDQVLVISQQQVIIEEDFMEEMREWLYG